MNYQNKIKNFFVDKGLKNQTQIAEALETNKDTVSKWMRAEKPTTLFLDRIKKYYPDAPLGYLVSENFSEELFMVNEPRGEYKTQTILLLEEIEEKLGRLKKILAHNSHNK